MFWTAVLCSCVCAVDLGRVAQPIGVPGGAGSGNKGASAPSLTMKVDLYFLSEMGDSNLPQDPIASQKIRAPWSFLGA